MRPGASMRGSTASVRSGGETVFNPALPRRTCRRPALLRRQFELLTAL